MRAALTETEVALSQDNADLWRQLEEAERLLRLMGVKVLGEDAGDQSLEHLRKGHSPELADISIAVEMHVADLQAEVERLAKENIAVNVKAAEISRDHDALREAARPFVEFIKLLDEVHLSPNRTRTAPGGPDYQDYDRLRAALAQPTDLIRKTVEDSKDILAALAQGGKKGER